VAALQAFNYPQISDMPGKGLLHGDLVFGECWFQLNTWKWVSANRTEGESAVGTIRK
jgi:hypothetical protein